MSGARGNMRLALIAALTGLLGWSGALCAADERPLPTADPLGPVRADDPVLPEPIRFQQTGGREYMLLRLKERMRALESDIQSVLAEYDGRRPALSVGDMPDSVRTVMAERDRARRDLERTLRKRREYQEVSDPLDEPAAETATSESQRWQAINQLEAVQCCLELAMQQQNQRQRWLMEGITLADGIAVDRLDSANRARYWYLCFSMHHDLATVHADAAERTRYRQLADGYLKQLRTQHPQSVFTSTANSLLLTADVLTPTVPGQAENDSDEVQEGAQ